MLERLISQTGSRSVPCQVLLIEPASLGVGVHRRDQADYLLLNTAAAQVTAFSDEEMVPGAPVTRGPAFLEWCRERGLCAPTGWWPESGRLVEGDDFMPRRVYGEYLAWAAGELLRRAPSHLDISLVRKTALEVRPEGGGAEVVLGDGTAHWVDLAIVTTGHGLPGLAPQALPAAGWVERPFPLPETMAAVRPGERVALLGAGLTAIDVIASLTVGRGGVFRRQGGTLEYLRSGQEPEVVLASRSGWLPCARPGSPRLRPVPGGGLEEGIEGLRRGRPDGAFDLDDLEPLIRAEMFEGVDGEGESATIERALGLASQPWRDQEGFRDSIVEQAKLDLAEARRGLGRSRLKERLETLRDQREALRGAVDPPGMTAGGHRAFFERVPALANRTAVGPQQERLEEVLCLIAHGIVRPGPGPRPALKREGGGWELRSTELREKAAVEVDLIVKAHLDFPETDSAVDPIARSLRRWGRVHPASPRFLDLDREGHPRVSKDEVCSAVAVFGPPAEGASYYNNYVLWPGTWSRLLTDLDRVLVPFLTRSAG